MKVLWLSPWMRPLARVYCDGLRGHGVDTLLVTSEQHPQACEPVDGEIVVDPRPKRPGTWPEFLQLRRAVREFSPDVVVAELVRDPRWLALAPGTPRVTLIHDDQPHGADEQRPQWERTLFDWWADRSELTICMSRFVAQQISRSQSGPIAAVALTSDVADHRVASPAATSERRDFVFIGRLNEYKNADVVLRAWRTHVTGPDYRGDVLHLFGAGDSVPDLPPSTEWHRGSYDYDDLLPVLARAKGSVAHYRIATQSGVQVLAMQWGVTPIVSDQGGLPEFQPPQCRPVGVDDIESLARTFDWLAEPEVAATLGALSATHYRDNFSNSVASEQLLRELRRVSKLGP